MRTDSKLRILKKEIFRFPFEVSQLSFEEGVAPTPIHLGDRAREIVNFSGNDKSQMENGKREIHSSVISWFMDFRLVSAVRRHSVEALEVGL
jgi:hypothetical protein